MIWQTKRLVGNREMTAETQVTFSDDVLTALDLVFATGKGEHLPPCSQKMGTKIIKVENRN